jgi:hypothetical protein
MHNATFVNSETPRSPDSSAEVEQLLSCTNEDETCSRHDRRQDEVEHISKSDAARRTVLKAEAVQRSALLSPLAVLRLLVRRTAFWHLTLAKALLLCVAIGSFAWMPTFYVRRGSLNIEQVRSAHNIIGVSLCSSVIARLATTVGWAHW